MKREVSIVTLIVVLLATVVFVLPNCRGVFASPDVAVKALENQGYSNVKITEHAWFLIGLRGGSEKDAARFTATATNPAGKEVVVEVYAGWPFKGATIRTR